MEEREYKFGVIKVFNGKYGFITDTTDVNNKEHFFYYKNVISELGLLRPGNSVKYYIDRNPRTKKTQAFEVEVLE